MGRKKAEELDPKARLVRDICSISSLFSSACTHRSQRSVRKPPPSAFVDWYLILRVDEDAGSDVIRKRYCQLALQLHPDKNKHPKADVAFKFVSEAYACLSDEARRRAFNLERWNSVCRICHGKFQSPSKACHEFSDDVDVEKKKMGDGTRRRQVRSSRSLQPVREVRDRMKEEAKVVENCVRAAAHGAASGREFPLFDPSDCLLFPDYPHGRLRMPRKVWYLHHTGDEGARGHHHQFSSRRGRCESPVYEISPEGRTKFRDFRF